jgi:zinc transporter
VISPLQPVVRNDGGLICGFRIYPQQRPEPIEWSDVADALGGPAALWLHFNLADVRARDWITACEQIPQTARDLLMSADHHVRFERVGVGLFAVVGDMHHDLGATEEALGLMRIYADARLVVTTRRHPLKSVDRLRRDLLEGMAVHSTLQFVVLLLTRIGEMFHAMVGDMGDVVDEAEDRLLVAGLHVDTRELGRVRRFLARLRRHIGGTRGTDVNGLLADWSTKADATSFRRALQRLDAVGHDLDLVQVRARLLQEETVARVGEATNRNIYFLSVVTALLLPISVITGVFGMNVGGLPFLETPSGFAWTMFLMGATLVGTIFILRWRRLL